MCCQNNFVIDYAKTLYKPELPEDIGKEIKVFTNKKLPAFFKYAKDKSDDQVCEPNESFVNKLYNRIPNISINTRGMKLDKLDYYKMMNNVNTICSKEVSELYDTLNKEYRYMVNMVSTIGIWESNRNEYVEDGIGTFARSRNRT